MDSQQMESWPAGTSPICGIWCMWEDRPSFKDRFLMIDRSASRSSPGMVFPGLPNESQRKSRPEKDPLMKRKVTSNALHFYLLWSTGSSRFFLDYLWAVDQEEEEEHNMKRHREFFRAVERSWFHWRSERIHPESSSILDSMRFCDVGLLWSSFEICDSGHLQSTNE